MKKISISLIICFGFLNQLTSQIFATPDTINLFGLLPHQGVLVSFGDLDNDGDDDLFTSTYNGDIKFFENIGTNTQAQFDFNFVLNPFSIQSYNNEYSFCSFSDIDSDGDIDLILSGDGPLQYLENLTIVNSIEEIKCNNSRVIKITDVLGRALNEKKNTTLFYLYEDGIVEKK